MGEVGGVLLWLKTADRVQRQRSCSSSSVYFSCSSGRTESRRGATKMTHIYSGLGSTGTGSAAEVCRRAPSIRKSGLNLEGQLKLTDMPGQC